MPASKILLTIKTDTKQEEREILGELLARLQYSPTFVTPSERPDFEIGLEGNHIGIEVTKFYSDYTKKGSRTQQKISAWKKFAEQLKARLSEFNPEYAYLYASVHFHNDKVNYKELLTDTYFSELIAFIKSARLNRNEQKTIIVTSDKFPLLSTRIDSIFLWDKYPDNIYLWWDSRLQSGEVITNESAVKAIVDKKNESSESYKQQYYQKWLIIYAGGIGLHDMFTETQNVFFRQGEVILAKIDKEQPDIDLNVSSPYFTHIILWDKFTEKIFLLFPYKKKIFDYGEGKIWVNHLPLK